MHPQMPLPLGIVPVSTFDTFYVSQPNTLAYSSVRAFVQGELDGTHILIWGASSVGKTHLLSASCQALAERGYRVAYLPGDLANNPDALMGLEFSDLLCIDDVQKIDEAAQVQLLHCINRCKETGARIVFACDRPVEKLELKQVELSTCLSWGPAFQLQALDGPDIRAAVEHLLNARSMQISDDVLTYILRHCPPDLASLMFTVEKLAQASINQQRRINVRLVRELLGQEANPSS